MKIGVTGTFASGKGVIANYLKENGFAYFHLGDEIREVARQEGIEITRKNLQDLGNRLRKERGGGAVAEIILNKIKLAGYDNSVIDSIRNPYEVEVLRGLDNFSLLAVDAPWTVRFERLKNRNRESDPRTLDDFFNAERRDLGEEDEMGQQVGKCMRLADMFIFNYRDLGEIKKEVDRLIVRPSWDEYFLGLAKKASERSKDPSTKVGAVIVRPDKSVCSVGYNGFPKKMPDNPELYANRDEKYARIIHAEKNALIFSRDQSHEGYTLYTWPMLSCHLCFDPMVQAGITRFVAPKPESAKLVRWGASIERVKKYAKECSVEVVEIEQPTHGVYIKQ